MALKIRLRQHGRNNRTVYRVVVTDSRKPRDGKYLEAVGWYNPIEHEAEKNLFLDASRIQHWLEYGAQLSESVEALLARGAPLLYRQQKDKSVARRVKMATKRKAQKQKTA